MENNIALDPKKFEFVPRNESIRVNSTLIGKRRILIGRSENCDIVVHHADVSAIHAVLEILSDGAKIYDMNSRNGTFVNDEKVVSRKIAIGDKVNLGGANFEFINKREIDLPPPILDVLGPNMPPIMSSSSKRPREAAEEILHETSQLPKKLPARPVAFKDSVDDIPSVVYPLAADPKAEFSEYIFEDLEHLYPIFKYDVSTSAVEVIIVFRDRIYSVDYIPSKDGIFHLKGFNSKYEDQFVEYPYLNTEEKFPFVTIDRGGISLQQPPGYETEFIGDDSSKAKNKHHGIFNLDRFDIVRFHREDHQVFIRQTDAPPRVASAPLMRRDADLKKYLFLCFLFVSLFLGAMFSISVDEELEKEKVPKIIRTIVYRQKSEIPPITPPEKEAVAKTEKAKKVVQKSPVKKVTEKKPDPVVKKKVVPKKVSEAKAAGSKTAKKVQQVKKAKVPSQTKVNKVAPKKVTSRAPKKGGGKPNQNRVAKSRQNIKSAGNVDAYKSFNLKSTINSLLAKGGKTAASSATNKASSSAGGFGDYAAGGEEVGEIRRAQVSQRVGSLTGAASGKLDTSKGAEGLVNKKTIYTAGIPSDTVVLGAMDPDIIRRILREHIPQFRYCYQKELEKASREFSGVIPMVFTIGASGSVTRAGLAQATRIPAKVKTCVINVLRGISFPEPLGGGTVEVKQPMNFYPNVR